MPARTKIRKLLERADARLAVAMRTRCHGPRRERVAQALGVFGEWGVGWAALGLTAASLDQPRRQHWLNAAAAGPVTVWLNYAVKLAVRRERPQIEGHERLGPAVTQLSFPSAHATSSFAAATALGRIGPGAKPALYALAVAIAAGRPYLGLHYPGDVIAGALLGREIGRHWPLPGVPMRESFGAEVWAR